MTTRRTPALLGGLALICSLAVVPVAADAASATTATVGFDRYGPVFRSTGDRDSVLRLTETGGQSPVDPDESRITWTFTDRAPLSVSSTQCRHPSRARTTVVSCSVDYTISDEVADLSVRIFLGPGNDRVTDAAVDDAHDRIYGQAGDDRLVTTQNNAEVVDGGSGDDVLVASAVDGLSLPEFDGGPGSDRIDCGRSTMGVRIAGGPGNDSISGGRGADRIYGNSGNDRVRAGRGNDYVSGASGNDTIFGNSGDDRLVGGAGVDTISGGPGRNSITP